MSCTSLAWFDRHVLAEARKPPWCFVVGNLQEQAAAIERASVGDLDCVSLQLRHVMRLGLCTRMEVENALLLMQQCSWSTLEVEQSHGSLASCHRASPDCLASTLAIRSFLHMCRAFFSEAPAVQAERRLQAKLERLQRPNPNMLRATSLWYQEVAGIVSTALGEQEHLPLQFWQKRLTWAGEQWHGMTTAEKGRFTRLAEARRQEMWQDLHEKQEAVATALRQLRQAEEERKTTAPVHHVGSNRFTDADMEALHVIFHKEAESEVATRKFVDKVADSARELDSHEMAAMALQQYRPTGFVRRERIQAWAQVVADNRDLFIGACLVMTDPATGLVQGSWQVLCATQKPRRVFLQPVCHWMSISMPEADKVQVMHFPDKEHWMKQMNSRWLEDLDVSIDVQEQELGVLPRVEAWEGAWLYSDFDLTPWYLFVKNLGLPEQAAARGGSAAARPRREVPAWAARWLQAGPSQASGPPAAVVAPVGGRSSDEPAALTAEQCEEVEQELAEVRAWLAGILPAWTEHFSVRILGGRWTRRWRQATWDCVQGYSRSALATQFCNRFDMRQSCRFGRAEHSRQEGYSLAIAWAERMQYYLDMWAEGDCEPMEFNQSVGDRHDDLDLVNEMLAKGPETEFWARGQLIRQLLPGPWQEEEED